MSVPPPPEVAGAFIPKSAKEGNCAEPIVGLASADIPPSDELLGFAKLKGFAPASVVPARGKLVALPPIDGGAGVFGTGAIVASA